MTKHHGYRMLAGVFPNILTHLPLISYDSLLTTHMIALLPSKDIVSHGAHHWNLGGGALRT